MSNSQDIKLNEEYNKILRKYELNLFEKKKEKLVKPEIKVRIINNPEIDQVFDQTQMQQMIDNINNNIITDPVELNHINNIIQNYNLIHNNLIQNNQTHHNLTVEIPPIPAHVFTDTDF